MNVSIILAHPDEKSFNHAIAKTVFVLLQENGHNVVFHDLYREDFDPILHREEIPQEAELSPHIEEYCREIARADGIVVVHPNWWGQPPAILKGWIDRVLRPGVAYQFLEGDTGEGVPVGLLKAETALIFNTSNTPQERERSVFEDPLESLWKNCIFDLCGVRHVYRKMFGIVITSTVEQRRQWLAEVKATVNRQFPRP